MFKKQLKKWKSSLFEPYRFAPNSVSDLLKNSNVEEEKKHRN